MGKRDQGWKGRGQSLGASFCQRSGSLRFRDQQGWIKRKTRADVGRKRPLSPNLPSKHGLGIPPLSGGMESRQLQFWQGRVFHSELGLSNPLPAQVCPISFPSQGALRPPPWSLWTVATAPIEGRAVEAQQASQRGMAMVFSKALDGRGGARAAEKPPPPQGHSCHQLLASTLQLCLPPLCPAPSGGVSTGRRHWKQPSRGFSGLAHCGGGARAAAPPSACYCPTAARVGGGRASSGVPSSRTLLLGSGLQRLGSHHRLSFGDFFD